MLRTLSLNRAFVRLSGSSFRTPIHFPICASATSASQLIASASPPQLAVLVAEHRMNQEKVNSQLQTLAYGEVFKQAAEDVKKV